MDRPSLVAIIRASLASAGGRRWIVLAASAICVAALAVAGAAGVSQYVVSFVLYRGFAAPSAPHSVVVRGQAGSRPVPVILPAVQTITVRSQALGGYSDLVYVVLPPGYASHPGQRYPVLYLLHGSPGAPRGFLDICQVATQEATLVAAGRMKPLIMVMPTGGRSLLDDTEWANGIRKGNEWETFVAVDLVPAIDGRYRTIAAGSGRGIAGMSEGGYAALNIGLHHPGEFGLLEAWSGYMLAENTPAIFGRDATMLAYNSPAQWVGPVAPRLRADHTYIWFYCGTSDPLHAQNRRFATELTRLGVAHQFVEAPGSHDWRLWRRFVPPALITASEYLSHD